MRSDSSDNIKFEPVIFCFFFNHKSASKGIRICSFYFIVCSFSSERFLQKFCSVRSYMIKTLIIDYFRIIGHSALTGANGFFMINPGSGIFFHFVCLSRGETRLQTFVSFVQIFVCFFKFSLPAGSLLFFIFDLGTGMSFMIICRNGAAEKQEYYSCENQS